MLFLGTSSPAQADIVYLYDDLGRLVRVIRADGEAATYHYDAVGNIRQITRESGVGQTVTIGAVSVSSVDRATTTSVTISGSNLIGCSVITAVGGLTIQNVRSDLPSLTFDLIVSAVAPLGSATLTFVCSAGTTAATVAISSPAPIIGTFTPTFGGAGSTVTISGQFFDERAPANNTVVFNGVAGVVTAATESSLAATVPAGATSGPITVAHAGGSATSTGNFITGTVTVTSVTPASVARGDTRELTIAGSNLLGTAALRPGVEFTTVAATATQLTVNALVATDAPREGAISVTNKVTSASVAFSAVPGAPAVTAFSPTGGLPGDVVTIAGSGFDEVVAANNAVAFSGVPATVLTVTPTRLTAKVPTGAATGPISVTTPAGSATSALAFTVFTATGVHIVGIITPPFTNPLDIKVSPDGTRAYVMDLDSVKVVDTATHTGLSSIPVTASAVQGVITPDGSRLYVTGGNQTTSVVDLVNNVELTTIPVGGAIERGELAITPDGNTVYLVDFFQGAVHVIDTATNTLLTTLAAGPRASSVMVSPDGRHVYVNGYVDAPDHGFLRTITVVDPTSNTVVTTITGGRRIDVDVPGVFSPDSARYYVAFPDVTVIDTSTATAIAAVPNVGDVSQLVVNAAGTRLYAATFDSPLAVIDTATNTVAATVPVPLGGPGAMVLTPDGQRLVLEYETSSAPRDFATVVDTATNTVIASVPLDGEGGSAAAAIDNQRIYVSMLFSGNVSVVDLATNVALDVPIARTGAAGSPIVFAPNGGPGYGPASSTVVASFDPATLQARRNLSFPDDFGSGPFVAVDPVTGGTLYVAGPTAFHFLDPTTGAILATLPIPDVAKIFPSPDGSRVLLVTFEGNVVAVDATSRTQVATLPLGVSVSDATVNRNGTRLYVGSFGNTVSVVAPAGPTLVTTIPLAGLPSLLALTADGEKLLALTGDLTSIIVIDTTANTVVATITPGGSLSDVVTSPTTTRAYIGNKTNNRVDILDTTTKTIVGGIALTAAPTHLGVTPNGARLYVVQGDARVASVIDTQATTVVGTVVIPGADGPVGQVFFAPSGRAFIQQFEFLSPLFVIE